ncbi:hypothetical protein WMY93_011359 [Mugilogobius chulae]|uniref:Capsid protein n=1 Tax=Mugilogobius chulae TaxID=88201 RepID=A0AAW0P278_9GOBI
MDFEQNPSCDFYYYVDSDVEEKQEFDSNERVIKLSKLKSQAIDSTTNVIVSENLLRLHGENSTLLKHHEKCVREMDKALDKLSVTGDQERIEEERIIERLTLKLNSNTRRSITLDRKPQSHHAGKMSVVTLDPSSYSLKPLETILHLIKAPNFLSDPSGAFAEYMADNILRASATNSSISAEAMIVMSQAHMGVTLFRQQRETSRLLAAFVYKMLVPDGRVPTGTRFSKRYRITDQREAQQGTYDTVGNGVQTREYSQVFQHTSKVVTMQFGCLLDVTVPSVAEDLIRRELDRVSTSWELTRTLEVLKYCAAQPTLTDRVALKTRTHSRAEKLDSILTMAELMCGMINIQPDSFVCALENARRVLASDRAEVVIMGDTLFRVISQRSSSNVIWTQIVSEDATVTPEFSVYTAASEHNKQPGCYEFTMQHVSQRALGNKDLPFTNESSFQDTSIDMKVNYIRLGGGSAEKIPIVHVDGVQMEHGQNVDTSTEFKAFCNSEGFKWEYFTVGCTAPALNQISPSQVLSTAESDEISYKQLAQRSPAVSFIHQYDGGVNAVSLRSLHEVGNPKELFSQDRRVKLQTAVNNLVRGDLASSISVEKLASLAWTRDWHGKISNPASVLEFDTRNMVVPRPRDGSYSIGQDLVPEHWIVRPRVALFNSSGMNNIDNEIAQIGSELLTHFGDGEQAKQVALFLTFLEDALHYEHGINSMLIMRHRILQGETTAEHFPDGWAKGRLYWSWLTDPICTVYIRRWLGQKETDVRATITSEEQSLLLQLEGAINSLLGLFKSILGKRENSVISFMPVCFKVTGNQINSQGYPRDFTSDDMDYCNLMYWIILPALGARVFTIGGESGAENVVETICLPVRPDGINLSTELKLPLSAALTVSRMAVQCFFMKVAPQGSVDHSHCFEPTALVHKRCTDAGFSNTSLVTYLWAIRLQKLASLSNNIVKVLLGIHYSTLLTHGVIMEHYDTKYYSGMSYLLFRGVRFTGCGVSLMQQKSALYTLGTKIICKPTAHNTHQVHTVNQYCESVVIPETLESPGVYIPNLYMKDVRGGDVHFNTGSPFDMVVADAFNGFCPESDSACGYRRPYIFTTGRSERLNGSVTLDPMMRADAYTCMPTLLRPFSSTQGLVKSRHSVKHRNAEESNLKLFCNTLHMVEFEKGVLDPIGDPFKDTVDRVNGDKRTTDVMQPLLGVAFCGTYGIGFTSDKKLMCASDPTREPWLID